MQVYLFGPFNHFTPKSSHTLRYLDTRKLPNGSTGKSINRIGTNLQGQLTPIKDGPLGGISFPLQIRLGPLPSRQQVFKDPGEDTFAHVWLTKVIYACI